MNCFVQDQVGLGDRDLSGEIACCCIKCPKDVGSRECLKRVFRRQVRRLRVWLLDVEMGFVWGVAGIAMIVFVFAAIWYIDPALLTLMLRFRQAECKTRRAVFLRGISNCTWTSCKLGCTREIYQCWQIQVDYSYSTGSKAFLPPWASLSDFFNPKQNHVEVTSRKNLSRLYPNVRGCGYPPELNCEDFYAKFGVNKDGTIIENPFTCWVATIDSSVAMTVLDLERAKEEVIMSLVPLLVFILFVIYAFCRMGIFTLCNPLMYLTKKSQETSRSRAEIEQQDRKPSILRTHGCFQLLPTEEDHADYDEIEVCNMNKLYQDSTRASDETSQGNRERLAKNCNLEEQELENMAISKMTES